MKSFVVLLFVSGLLALGITFAADNGKSIDKHSKAAYLSSTVVEFLRPGLNVTIKSGSVTTDGVITVVYTLTDPAGLPLDTAGVYTPGPITLGYVAAYIPANQEQYVAYTTTSAKGTAGTFTVAGADSGGVLTPLDSGKYQYVFKTKAPAGFDASATHTIGVYARRDLSAFGVPNNNASDVFTFVPNGSPVTHVRDIVKTSTCNSCHDQLSHHGGRRRQVEMCVMCHTPQSVDPNTGGTVDFKVMIHKIHMGSQLPSVIAGTPYTVINTDFSTVVFPSDIRRCEKCHDQTSGATQANYYLTKPTRAACGSCHDNVNFASGQNHVGGPQIDDNLCANCHFPQGELEFDASIKGAHVIPNESSMLSGIQVVMSSVQNHSAGQKPVVTFTVKDGQGNALPLARLDRLSFTMAGPTTDYGYTNFGSDVTTPGYVTESALSASTCGADGTCTYSFTHAIPADGKGTYSVGLEARRTETLLANTTKQQTAQYSPKNQVINFSVDGSAVVARRTVVDINNCNSRCHTNLSMHGGPRNQTAYCVLCHNPSNTDASMRAIAKVPADQAAPAQGINFSLLIHRLHTGVNLPSMNAGMTVVGFGGSHNDFTTIRYPAFDATGNPHDTRNCSICHTGGSEQKLPLGMSQVMNPAGLLNPMQPIGAACTACHADKSSASHALANTDALGESCTVCHGAQGEFNIGAVHAQY